MKKEKCQHNENKVKKVCIIRSNPVRPDSRVEKEAWTLKKKGYDVHILAWDRDADYKEQREISNLVDVKVPITRLGYKASFGDGFKNIRPYLKFQYNMRKWIKKHHFDVVHACDFDTAFFSYGIVRRKKEKFVFDIFDFLYDEPKGLLQWLVKRAQYFIINHADATIICTEKRKKQIYGAKPRRLAVIHNTPALAQIGDVRNKVENTQKTKIVYVGILQDYRLLKEIAEVVSESDNIELHIGGFGKYEDYFLEMAEQSDNIKFYGRLSYEQTLKLESDCDIMLAIYDPTIANHRYAAPNKFYESLMIGKPVVMVEGTGMSDIVKQHGIGVLIDYSKEGFKEGINKVIEMKCQWNEIKEKMQKLYREEYSWEKMSIRLIDLYNQLI